MIKVPYIQWEMMCTYDLYKRESDVLSLLFLCSKKEGALDMHRCRQWFEKIVLKNYIEIFELEKTIYQYTLI